MGQQLVFGKGGGFGKLCLLAWGSACWTPCCPVQGLGITGSTLGSAPLQTQTGINSPPVLSPPSPSRRPYFGRLRFDMAYWSCGFPADALCLSCIAYNVVRPGELSQGIAYASLAAASVINVVLFIQTMNGLCKLRVGAPSARTSSQCQRQCVRQRVGQEEAAVSEDVKPLLHRPGQYT